MNWSEILTQLLLGILGTVISAVGVYVTYLINKFIKNDKLKTIVASLNELVQKSVLEIYQVYVESLKKQGNFNETAQREALQACLDLIKKNMPKEVETWLKTNYTDVEAYLKSLIEAQIGLLKNQSK